MPDVNKLSEVAMRVGVDFTGPIGHAKIVELAEHWLPDVNFHEVERFHSIDLEQLYTVPAEDFADFDPATQQEFAVRVDGTLASPPVIVDGGKLRGQAASARDALLEPDVGASSVYTHGGSIERSDKFFASVETRDGTPVPGPGNPRLPREPGRVRVEFRMLLETLKQDLALTALALDPDSNVTKPQDALWGDFDVTDLLLRRIDPDTERDDGPASPSVRWAYARQLIEDHEAGDDAAVTAALISPPPDGETPTQANGTVWRALTTCGLLEYHFIYAYNDFHRYGGLFTNQHEGDNEGCCLVFERERLSRLQALDGDPATVAPLGLITSVHNESNKADEMRPVDGDAGDARDGLDVYVARGSHATYLTAGTHDFFDISDLLREDPARFVLAALASLLVSPLLLPALIIYEHFNPDPDETSADGVTFQREVDPASDPATHLRPELAVTPLSDITTDTNVYDLSQTDPRTLAVRAFRGRLGAHDGTKDHSPRWENKTRRYFEHLVRALEAGRFRQPQERIVID